MKTIFKLLSLLFIPLLFVGCSDDETDPIIEASDLRLIDPGITNVNLNINTPEADAFLISWDDYSAFSGTYTVQVSNDASFENVVDLGTTTNNHFTVSMAALNAIVNQMGYTPYLATPVYIRVTNGSLTSNNISFTVKSYPQSGPSILTPEGGSAVTLSPDTPDDEAVLISWNDFAYSNTDANVTYTVQMALAGTNFENPVTISNTSNTSISVSHADLNDYALAAGIEELATGDVEIRILSNVEAATGETLQFQSAPVTMSITTHESGIKFFYLVGEAVAAGWNPDNNNQPLFNDPANPATAYFTGYFAAGGFKVLEEIGAWQPQWGTNDGSTLVLNDGSGSDPGTFSSPGAGYYTFTFMSDGPGGTFTMTPFDASAAPTYSTIGIIGDATADGWTSDQDMTQSSFDPHQWFIQGVTLNDGFLKFRAENGWDINWGSPNALYGQATQGGDNIPVTAGTYDIWFNDLDGRYVLIPQG